MYLKFVCLIAFKVILQYSHGVCGRLRRKFAKACCLEDEINKTPLKNSDSSFNTDSIKKFSYSEETNDCVHTV